MSPADAVIALPRLTGPHIAGLPGRDGFLPIDAHARVTRDVFAAGDATTEPVKQGDAAAEAIAAEAGRGSPRGRSPASCAHACSRPMGRSSSAATSTPPRTSSPAAT